MLELDDRGFHYRASAQSALLLHEGRLCWPPHLGTLRSTVAMVAAAASI